MAGDWKHNVQQKGNIKLKFSTLSTLTSEELALEFLGKPISLFKSLLVRCIAAF